MPRCVVSGSFAVYADAAVARGGGGEASTSDSPWTRLSRVRRVREEASGWLGVEKGSGALHDLCDGVARRAVDDATRLEWLLNEPHVRRVWRYENTVRVCEFHKQALRRDYGGRHARDDEIRQMNSNDDELKTPSRCFEAAPEVCGAVRAGPHRARSSA